MKYSIFGFDQRTLCAINASSEKKIDCTDLVIIQWIAEFIAREKTRKVMIEGNMYAWVSQSTLADDFPFMEFSKRTFADRLDKLSTIGIIEKRVEKQKGYGTFTYLRLTSMYDDLLYTNEGGDAVQTPSGCGSNTIPDAVQTPPKDLYTNIPINKTNKETEKDKSFSSKKSDFSVSDFLAGLMEAGVDENVARDWISIRKAKKASNTATALKLVLNSFSAINDKYGISANDAITVCVARGWYGCQTSYFDNVNLSDFGLDKAKNKDESIHRQDHEIDIYGNRVKTGWQ